MSKRTLYIAGPIKGRDMDTTALRFYNVELIWMKTHRTINPISYINGLNEKRKADGIKELSDDNETDRVKILQHTVSRMALCDEVLMLKGWQESEGATLERNIAVLMGKHIYYEE